MSDCVDEVSQNAFVLHLAWHEGDPISLEFTAEDVDWSGPYQLQVREAQDRTSTLLATLTMSGTYVNPDTDFVITASAGVSATVPAGEWYYDAQQVGGITRLRGRVRVTAQVTG